MWRTLPFPSYFNGFVDVNVVSIPRPGICSRNWLARASTQSTTVSVAPCPFAAASGCTPADVTWIAVCLSGNAVPFGGGGPPLSNTGPPESAFGMGVRFEPTVAGAGGQAGKQV